MNAHSGTLAAMPALDQAAEAGDWRHAFLRSAWFPDAERVVAVARADGSVAAALPLLRKARVVPAVAGPYWPLRSVAMAPDADAAALLDAVPGPLLRIGPVRADDPSLARLEAAGRRVVLKRRLGTAFLLDLAAQRREGPWPRASTLKKNRWFEKQLAAEGALAFETVRGAGWSPRIFDLFATIERNSWLQERTDTRDAKFLASGHRRFWESAAADPVLADRMRGSILSIGGVPAAFTFGIEAPPVFYLIANSYDRRFARHSPGRVLIYRELARLFEAGFDEVDWGSGDPGYKSAMGGQPGPDLLDCLFVRGRLLAAALRPLWER